MLLLLLTLCECSTDQQSVGQDLESDFQEIVNVAVAADVPGYFVIGGENYGYSHDLINAFAQESDRMLDLTTGEPLSRLWNNLENNSADMAVSMSSEVTAGALSLPLYSTNYVVLANAKSVRGQAKRHLTDIVKDGVVMISSGFERTKSYDAVLDSLPGAKLYISPKDGYELADGLLNGDFDFLVCEASEALMAREFIKGIKTVYEFGESVEISLVFSSANSDMYDNFVQWFDQYRQTEEFARTKGIYLDKGFKRRAQAINQHTRIVNGISVWDNLLREVGTREGVDWKLLSAIAYKESRFHHNVISKSGATGLMQIMPVTARHFKVDQRRLTDPEVNVELAAKLIKSIENLLDLPSNASPEDRLSLILAGYNCGVGTVSDAMKLAKAIGENPTSWRDVSHCLELMGDDQFKCDDLSYRRFTGGDETLQFVSGVKRRYDMYRANVD